MENVIAIKVKGLEDIGRMAASLVTVGQPTYILRFKSGDRHVLGILAVFRDFYKYYGVPMFYYYVTSEPGDGNYVAVKSDEAGERVEVVKGPRPGWVMIPIVNLSEKPPFIPEDLA